MAFERLTFRSVTARPVLLPMRRPVVSKVGLFDRWPMILIDIETEEGIVGRSYLEPYLKGSARAIISVIHELAAARAGQPIRPLDDFQKGLKAQNLVGLEGVSMIAVSGLDMAAWDALAKAAGMPLAVFLGGSLGPVPAYNSNGLWLTEVASLGDEAAELVAEGGFRGLKLRLGRERLADDLAAIRTVRAAVGDDIKLMVDFNQGLSLGDALHRCHALDDEGLYWLEEPIAYNNLAGFAQLARELKTPIQLGENFYGPRALYQAHRDGLRRLCDARPDADRRRDRLAARRRDRRRRRHRDVDASLSGVRRASDARDRNRALARMAGLGRSGPRRAVQAGGRLPAGAEPPRRRHRMGRGCGQALSVRRLTCQASNRRRGVRRRVTVLTPALPAPC